MPELKILVDIELLDKLQTSANFEKHKPQRDTCARIATANGSLLWTLEQLSKSKQFTSEQRQALQLVIENCHKFVEEDARA